MNLPPLVFGAPLLLAGSLLTSVLAAAPNCPDGQVWDSKNQRCVSQRTTRLPDAERSDYANGLAQQGRDEAAIVAGNQA
ncbi:hypothetical protein SAMN04489802_3131 [Pseudomonas chlororaphis]|uniref:hypothetical protein n=1 Tax=Pseudomonas chlororaphis TaxID=587753 RepID=UPI00087C58BB|nr:hypothetical protein [Pseudomonas chlororaphis]AZD67286.1 hypothetical protein C4K17_3400 [Pseudomonas chlororaphis subsp. aurantiaca]QIT23281.1 hypothetical protein HCN09_16560 [Pseudomonas chlororaphis subsp. aurantiaca]WDH01369.1 hypothetical protein PUP57_17695 [Pseudomonas chlororaphis]WDH09784.1 hypothetical protein PUP64_29320 [Pseudomonas chlororaphis]SDT08475.1 hypothetical protein SAMN04489802_3131 [Pseudomonas chlororaphis]